MTPDFLIEADGSDITPLVRDRLVSLRLVDEQGFEADRLVMTIDDRDSRVALPAREAELELRLGYRETGLSPMGLYVVDAVSVEGPVQKITIRAQAADMTGRIRSPKTRAWEDVTLGDIVKKIAGEAGLDPVVGEDIAATHYDMVAQTAESDLHLLTRLAEALDATAKPAAGRLVVVRRGSKQTAEGEDIPPVLLPLSRLTRWNFDLSGREVYKTVKTEWAEIGAGQVRVVEVGEGEPILELREVYGSEEAAKRAADAALNRARRGLGKGTLELGGFDAGLFAGGLVELPDIRAELSGEWHIRRVEHELGAGLRSRVDVERGEDEEGG